MSHKKTTSVSIIIPAYNAEKTISHCLDSIGQQTIIPTEIIVVDDGSTDQTKKVVVSYKNITYFYQKNKGPAVARNVGAQKSKGNIIIFLDSDCVPEKNWLEEMLKPFEDEKVVGVQGAYKTKQTSWVAQFDQLDIEYRYLRMKKSKKLDWIGSYSAAYRRKIFLEEEGFDENFPKASGEDAELSYRLAEKGMKLVFNSNAIVYHTHPGTLMHYLRVKFFRAYWRTRMYIKYPKKGVKDSYTPHLLKINFFVGGLFLLVSAFIVLQLATSSLSRALLYEEIGRLIFILEVIFFVIVFSMYDFVMLLLRRDPVHIFHNLFLVFARSIVFVLGAGFGLLDRRVWE